MAGPDRVRDRSVSLWPRVEVPGPPKTPETAAPPRATPPWEIDVDRLPASAPVPSAVFARLPPAAASTLPAASDALDGVKLARPGDDLPASDRTDTSRAFAVGPYKLYPELRRGADGAESVVYYTAVRRATHRAELVVGPEALSRFEAHVDAYASVALRVFARGAPDAGAAASMKVAETAMSRGVVAALDELPRAWNLARKDPRWVASTALGVLTAAAPLPGVSRAEAVEADTVAGGASLRGVNIDPAVPLRGTRTMNCGNCAIATDATLAGRPAAALAGHATTAEEVAAYFPGSHWSPAAGVADIEATMRGAGTGTRAIVFGTRGPGELGHFFNVVNQDGTIRFLDGQTARAADLEAGYRTFYLLRTR